MPDGAQFLTRAFVCAAGGRTFKLYIPRATDARRRPLLVMLHGCAQDPDDFAIGSGMNAFADQHGLLVAYPAQSRTSNPSSCWNWFNPADQVRGAGEPSIIAGITRQIVADYDIDPNRVFVAGMSAGGAMAAVMGATYPDLYGAIGVHSGLPYRSASDVVSAFAAMRGEADTAAGGRFDDRVRESTARVRAIVFHGSADQTVHPSNAEKLMDQFRRMGDTAESTRISGLPGEQPATRTVIRDQSGNTIAELWIVSGSSHAWSGGSAEGTYTDPQGPKASREMLRFFLMGGKLRDE